MLQTILSGLSGVAITTPAGVPATIRLCDRTGKRSGYSDKNVASTGATRRSCLALRRALFCPRIVKIAKFVRQNGQN
jgi:hypothetical protein